MNTDCRYEKVSALLHGEDLSTTKRTGHFEEDEVSLESDPSSHDNRPELEPNNSQFQHLSILVDSFNDKTQGSIETCAPDTSAVICIADYVEGDTKKSIDLMRSSRFLFNDKSAQMQSYISYAGNSATRSPTHNKSYTSTPPTSHFRVAPDEGKNNRVLANITNLSESVFMQREEIHEPKTRLIENSQVLNSSFNSKLRASPGQYSSVEPGNKSQEFSVTLGKGAQHQRGREPGVITRTHEEINTSQHVLNSSLEKENDENSSLNNSFYAKQDGQPASILKKGARVGQRRSRSRKSNLSTGVILVNEETTTNEIVKFRDEKNPAERTHQRLQDISNTSQNDLRNVSWQQHESRGDISALLNDEREKIKQLTEKLDSKDQVIIQMTRLYEEVIQSLKETRNDVNASKKENENKVIELKATVLSLEGKNSKLEQENQALKDELSTMRKNLKESIHQRNLIEKQRDELLNQNRDITGQYQAYLDELQDKIAHLEKENSQLLEEVIGLKNEKERMSKEFINKIEKYYLRSQSTEQEMKVLKERLRVFEHCAPVDYRRSREETRSQSRKRSTSTGIERSKSANHTLLVESEASFVDPRAVSGEIENQEVLHQSKTILKFVELITSMAVECSPKGYWKSRPNVKQVWKWLKNLMSEYIELKSRAPELTRDSEILRNCMELLVVRSRSEVVPSLHSVLIGSNKMSHIIAKFKVLNSLTSLETMHDLEVFLDRKTRSKSPGL